ncbi:MAG: PAS domain-containing protein [Candidatus Schekmanbacteria bacterium]|nr:PAS domain-containing protein [Candidatus Schekmanbacteria bacterium]
MRSDEGPILLGNLAVDSLAKLDLLRFFAHNPASVDTAASLAVWADIPVVEATRALEELAAAGILESEAGSAGPLFGLHADESMMAELAAALAGYERTRHLLRRRLHDLRHSAQATELRLRGDLSRERARTSTIFHSVSDGLVAVDDRGAIVACNRSAAQMLFGLESPRGIPDGSDLLAAIDGLPEAVKTAVRKLLSEALDGGSDRISDLPFPGGRVVDLLVDVLRDENGVPLHEESGAPAGRLLCLRDVTSRHRLEAHRRDLVDLLTHDLRNPASSLYTLIDILLRSPRASWDQSQHDLLARGLNLSQHLLGMINDMLEVSRTEAGFAELDAERVAFSRVAAAAEAQVGPLFSDRQVTLLTVLPAHEVEGDWDQGKLVRVLTNLLTNALKVSRKGDRVQLRAFERRAGLSRPRLLVAVEDQGPGIPKEDLPHVFDKFYKVSLAASADASTRRSGTGLGLYFCRLVVEAHGGEIWADSRSGKGTTMNVALPLALD